MTKFDTDKPYKVFGDVLREILDRHGLSATRISAKIHEPKDMFRADSTISKYRTGERRPPKEWIDVLQRYFTVITDEEVVRLKEAWEACVPRQADSSIGMAVGISHDYGEDNKKGDMNQLQFSEALASAHQNQKASEVRWNITLKFFRISFFEIIITRTIVLFCLGLSIYTARRSIGLWLTCGYRRLCFLSSSTSRFVSPFPITD